MKNKQLNSELLLRAKAYPYERPNGSYLLESDRIIELKGRVLDGKLDKYIPVLAYGSNAAPDQLRKKLKKINDPVAVLSATIKGFDVVYASKFSDYGAIPATLAPSKGTVLQVYVVMLTKEHLKLVHKTERPHYSYGKLNTPILIDRLGFREGVFTYFYPYGYKVNKRYIAFEEVIAQNRSLLSMRHDQMLSLVHDKINPQEDLDTFIINMVGNKSVLKKNNDFLHAKSSEISILSFEQILPKKLK